MQFKKEILLFYTLIALSAGVIIAADQPEKKKVKKVCVKCCKITQPSPSAAPLNTITEGILRYKA
jgi:hypothetical protein